MAAPKVAPPGTLECRRRVDPEQPSFGAARISPTMRRRTFEIEAVAGFQFVVLFRVQPDFEFAAQDVQELFAFVSVRIAAAAVWFHAEEMRLHGGVAPSQEFHANARGGLQNFSLLGAHQARILSRSFEKGKDIRAIKAGDAAEGGYRRAHLAAFQGAEETDGDASGLGDLQEREAAASAKAAEALARKRGGRFGWSWDDSLAFQNVNDGGGVQAASAAKKKSALQEANIEFGVDAIAAGGALGNDKAESLPGAKRG